MSSLKWTQIFQENKTESILICRKNTLVEKHARERGLKVLSLDLRDYISPLASLKLKKILKTENIETLFLHRLTDIWLLAPIVSTDVKVFGFARIFLKNNSKNDFIHRWLYSKFNKIIALSSIQKKKMLELLPIYESQVEVIPNGIDVSKFSPGPVRVEVRESLGGGDDKFIIGLVGRLDKQKGHRETLEALAKLVEVQPNIHLALIGALTHGESGFEQELDLLIEKLGLRDRVTFAGHRKDMPDVLRALDIFVMPSYEENFANILLEAMACGCVCVATGSGGTPEILSSSSLGQLVEPRSGESLFLGIKDLLNRQDEFDNLKKEARRKACEEYDLKIVYSKIKAMI